MTPRDMSDETLMAMQRSMCLRGFGIRDAILTAEIKRRQEMDALLGMVRESGYWKIEQ